MIITFNSSMAQPKTIFCDIDGTLVEHTGDIIKNYQDNSTIKNYSLCYLLKNSEDIKDLRKTD